MRGRAAGIFEQRREMGTVSLRQIPPHLPPRPVSASPGQEVRLGAGGGESRWQLAQASGSSRTEYFWRNPIADARFQTVTDFDGVEQAAAVSRDGHFVAFLSDRDGQMDVWVTQVGSGQFHNLTHGSVPELVNPSIRTLGFSPDGSFVTFWVRKHGGSRRQATSASGRCRLWAAQPRPYLEGVAEFDWSHDGSRLAYHTPGPGDPLFVSDGNRRSESQTHLHCAGRPALSLSLVGA